MASDSRAARAGEFPFAPGELLAFAPGDGLAVGLLGPLGPLGPWRPPEWTA